MSMRADKQCNNRQMQCHAVLFRIVLMLAGAVFLVACEQPTEPPGNQHHSSAHGQPGKDASSLVPEVDRVIGLDVYADENSVHVLAAEQPAHSHRIDLTYTRSSDGGQSWSEPVAIPQRNGEKLYLSGYGGHPPQIAAHGERIVVMYAIHGDGWLGSGPIITVISDDGGRNWHSVDGPADHGVSDAQNFHDLLADAAGTFHAVWLDSRTGKQGLYHARSTDGGLTWSSDRVLDRQTCPCCRNTLAADAGNTLYTLYRDIDPRDMAVTRSTDSGSNWQRLATVGEFDWQYDACPHTGGGLAVAGTSVYATVWTGEQEHAGVHFLKSHDGGKYWSPPQRLGSMHARHSDLARHASGQLLAVWDSAEDDGMSIHIAMSTNGGTTWQAPQSLASSYYTLAHPRTVATDDGFVVFWIEEQADHGSGWKSSVFIDNSPAAPDAANHSAHLPVSGSH